MNSGEYESYILKEEELKLLLGGLGVKQLYGLLENDSIKGISKEKKNRAITTLYQNEIVELSGRGIVIRPEFSGIFSALRRSRICVTIHIGKQDVPVRCCYVSEKKIVLMEKCRSEKKALKVSCWKKEPWLKFLGDGVEAVVSGYIRPEQEKRRKIQKKWHDGTEEYLREKGMRAVLTFQDSRKIEASQRILVQEEGLATWLILHKREYSIRQPYSREDYGI